MPASSFAKNAIFGAKQQKKKKKQKKKKQKKKKKKKKKENSARSTSRGAKPPKSMFSLVNILSFCSFSKFTVLKLLETLYKGIMAFRGVNLGGPSKFTFSRSRTRRTVDTAGWARAKHTHIPIICNE